MDEDKLQQFRRDLRAYLIEGLVLRAALVAPMSGRRLSVQECLEALTTSLDASSDQLDQVYGEHFQDPALTALYADEAKDIVEKLKKRAAAIAKGFEKTSQ